MYKKIIFSIILILLTFVNTKAQLSTSSPYSRYGIGDLSYRGLGRNSSMGHCSAAIQSPYNINPLNPASYSAFRPNNFIFEVGFLHKFTYFENAGNKWYTNNSNIDYMVVGFAVKKWWGTSFGMQPYSSIGYNLEGTDSLFVDDGYTNVFQTYKGEGGLNKIYWGNAFQPINNLSLGFNLSCIIGSIDRNTETIILEDDYYAQTSEAHRYLVRGLNYNFGAQFCDSIILRKDTTKAALIYTIGATFDNGSSLRAFDTRQIIREITMNGNTFSDTLVNDTLAKTSLMMPQSFGAGISLRFNEQLTLAADYSFEKWKGLTIFNDDYNLLNSSYLGLGFEFCTDENSTIYKKTFRYRVGGYVQNTHLNINSNQIKQYGVTCGFGLPINSSILNMGLELGTRGTTDFNLLKESYIMFNLNFSLYDVWFLKSKFF